MSGAAIINTNLSEADLSNATIDGAEILKSVFDRVIFNGASLKNIYLAECGLTCVDFRNARFVNVDISNANLTDSRNLEKAKNVSSAIGI